MQFCFSYRLAAWSRRLRLCAHPQCWISRSSLNRFDEALADGNRAVELRPDWAKAYSRQALALFHLKRMEEAEASYRKGLELEPNNSALQQGFAQLQQIKQSGA